jgi:hypothetical protein
VEKTEIVESERLHVSSPALPSDRAEVSPNLRVLMFASAAGGDALSRTTPGTEGVGVSGRVSSPTPTQVPSPLLLSATRVVLMERVSGERYLHANVARFGQRCALRKPDASRVDR